jgi:two-component system, chemotaxis family, sensor kinase CheA
MTAYDVDRDALVRLFLEESEEGLAAMEEALVALESGGAGGDGLKTLFRVAHTLKGNAASLGLTELAEVTHEVEGVLDRLRAGSLAMSRQVADLLLSSVDTLRELLAEVRG